MKKTWQLIEQVVQASKLNQQEKRQVLNKLDLVLGSSLLESKYPLSKGSLTEREWRVYKDIITTLNESKTFPKVRNDFQYGKVVKEILAAVNNQPDKKLRQLMIDMDDEYQDGNWNGVNKVLDKISKAI